tara:strand:+ start:1327 stop:1689 length:363 start_codon:yes stop_codon:yes gene_type:complete
MKLLMENWRKYLKEEVFYVNISRLLPSEEMGHGKAGFEDYETESAIKEKIQSIESGIFEPIEVCNQKPVNPYRLQGKPPMEKTGQAEPFYFVLNGHHRLAAAQRLGIVNIPVILNKLEEQ